ncbi:MAG: NAD(P)-dependent oxidoreductase [Candidatus Bathyarchaeota archaeon]|nr:NAD(P)-dependent oxidoreductase [Candidatus Bathyarchaeota archaeon]
MKVLVTGGSGYIGSELMRVLKASGHDAISFDIASDPRDDVRDARRVGDAVSAVDVVYHLASPCIVQDSIKNPMKYWDHIVNGTANVAEACRKHGRRLIFTSTQLAGDGFRCGCCGQLQSPYASAKREAEKLVEALPDSVTVRLPNIIDLEGRDRNESRLFPRLNKAARETGVVRIRPPEDTPVTLVEVGECARNLLAYLLEGTGTQLMKGETMTIRQVAERVAALHGARVEVTP